MKVYEKHPDHIPSKVLSSVSGFQEIDKFTSGHREILLRNKHNNGKMMVLMGREGENSDDDINGSRRRKQ